MTQAQLSELAFQAIKEDGFKPGDYILPRDLEYIYEEGFKAALRRVEKFLDLSNQAEGYNHLLREYQASFIKPLT